MLFTSLFLGEVANRKFLNMSLTKLSFFLFFQAAFLVLSCTTGTDQVNPDIESQTINWEKEFPGIWKSEVYKPSKFNLLNATYTQPREKSLNGMDVVDAPIDMGEVVATKANGKVFLRFPLDREEQIYGLGLHFHSVQQRGRILKLHMDHYGGRDNGRTHAPVPFFVSSKGYGVLINTARYIDAYVGTGVTKDSKNPPVVRDRNTDGNWQAMPYSDNLEFVIPGEGVELIFFAGKDMMEVVQRFNLYCGGGFIPPKWGLGFWHRTPTLYSDKDVEKEALIFKEKGFPLDVVGLEPGWHSKAYPCSFEWSKERFPEPGKFTEKMLGHNIRLNLWCNPYLWPGSNLDKKMEKYIGSHTVWNGTVPDYTIPEARKVMQGHMLKHQIGFGVSGYKIDEVDGYDRWLFPDVATFPSGKDGETMRQVYGNLFMDLTTEQYRKGNTRTFGLVRAANAGSVSYPFVIYNDYYSHNGFITALVNSGFNGVLWTPEVRSGGSAEDWVRRMQTVCFSPMAMLNAWADGTKPWTFNEVYNHCKEVALLRMQLLPYIYSIYADYYFTGRPPFYAINLLEGYSHEEKVTKGKLDGTKNPYAMAQVKEVKDQYMMGPSIMVAPMFEGQSERKVLLPAGKWYDFYTGDYVGSDEEISVEAGIDKIPLFVKDGAIIPMIPPIRQTVEWAGNSLELRVYGHADGKFILYDDDGETFNYERGEYATLQLEVKEGKGHLNEIPTQNWNYGEITWRYMVN